MNIFKQDSESESTFNKGVIQIKHNKIEIGLSWDVININNTIDLDASCILFDRFGLVNDCCFFNNLKCNGVTHSGDCRQGELEGDDEIIKVNFLKLDHSVNALVFVVSCFSGGDLTQNVGNIEVTIREGSFSQQIDKFGINCKEKGFISMICCVIYRSSTNNNGEKGGGWNLKKILRFSKGKKLPEPIFLNNILEEIGFLYPKQMLNNLNNLKQKKFDFKKDGLINLGNLSAVYFSLHWDIGSNDNDNEEIDLDSSIIGFDENKELKFIVFYDNKSDKSGSVIHYGDDRSGKKINQRRSTEDNELILVKFRQLPSTIVYLFFIVTVFHLKKDFKSVNSCHVRILNSKKEEMFRYEIKDDIIDKGKLKNAKIMFKVFRNPMFPLNWKFIPMNVDVKLSKNMNAKEIIPLIERKSDYLEIPELSVYEKDELKKMTGELNRLKKLAQEYVDQFLNSDIETSMKILENEEYLQLKESINTLRWAY